MLDLWSKFWWTRSGLYRSRILNVSVHRKTLLSDIHRFRSNKSTNLVIFFRTSYRFICAVAGPLCLKKRKKGGNIICALCEVPFRFCFFPDMLGERARARGGGKREIFHKKSQKRFGRNATSSANWSTLIRPRATLGRRGIALQNSKRTTTMELWPGFFRHLLRINPSSV